MTGLEIILIAASAIIAYLLLILPTQWLKIEHIREPSAGLGIRVLQLSDIHAERTRISPAKLRRLIETLKPDYVFVTGDFTERARHLPKVKRYAEAIGSAGVPVYAVLGNHDHRLKPAQLDSLVHLLERNHIRVLRNESVLAEGRMRFVGIDDYGSKKSRFDEAFAEVEPNMPVVVLTHDPNAVLHLRHPYRYLMAGHFHGMQFNIPPLFRFINKGKLASSGIYKGLHRMECGTFYISKGIGQAGPNARLFVRSEVTLHEL